MEQQHQERPREVYQECMRNHHAVKLGTYASDWCCEYTPDDSEPAAMLCAACGCHRNFHQKAFLDVAAGSPGGGGGGGVHGAMLASPGAAPSYGMHLAMAAAGGMGGDGGALGSGGRRRTRAKFTEEQKERMARFVERLG